MKKILALILVLASSVTLFSCGSGSTVKKVNKMLTAYMPTKIVTETKEDIGATVLTGKYEITMGTVDGKSAATLFYSYQKLRSIEDGSGKEENLPWEEVTLTKEYHEDKGVRENGDKWQKDGEDFSPTMDDIALEISARNVKDIVEDEAAKTITFTVPKDKTADVFGEDMAPNADVLVTIVHDGAVVINMKLTYTVPAAEKGFPNIVTTIETAYFYEPQEITIK